MAGRSPLRGDLVQTHRRLGGADRGSLIEVATPRDHLAADGRQHRGRLRRHACHAIDDIDWPLSKPEPDADEVVTALSALGADTVCQVA